MNNYTRVIRIGGKHVNANIRPFHGDSIGHWEGDTLVVETTNFSPHHARGMDRAHRDGEGHRAFHARGRQSDRLRIHGRGSAALYATWRGEMSFMATHGRVYEYACHEGNYALARHPGGRARRGKATRLRSSRWQRAVDRIRWHVEMERELCDTAAEHLQNASRRACVRSTSN